jgi:hypothetical protein
MILKSAAVAALGLACVCGQAYAQSTSLPRLAGLEGAVLVDHGDGFVRADSTTVLRGGDRVTAARGSQVRIAYKDGCTITVDSRSMATIDSASPCAGGMEPRVVKASYAEGDQSSGGWMGLDTTGLIIGGLAVAGIIAVIVEASHNHNHNENVGGVGTPSP